MNKKIYDLMNWPEIEGIVYSECDNPKELLGGHVCDQGFLIQAFRPDAVEVTVQLIDKKKMYQMEKVDEAGYFATLIPGKKVQKYTITAENLQGRKETYIDPYASTITLNEKQVNAFEAGCCTDAYKLFGSHLIRDKENKGVLFTVWAPNAMRVSVVGEFNHWDGRIHQMNRTPDSGIFYLFVPGLTEGTEYAYEVKSHGGEIALKADPYAHQFHFAHNNVSVVCSTHRLVWQDSNWVQLKQERPMVIYEMKQTSIQDAKQAKQLVQQIKQLGFTHVELMPVCEYTRDQSQGYETFGYYALTQRIGGDKVFGSFVNECHKEGIGVIMDWNAAFMGQDRNGLTWFDGTPLYETDKTNLDGTMLNVATFDYKKPQVRSFLCSSLMYWITRFHLDGIRIDEVASMLYLNYGKQPGEWKVNIYGGTENLDAVGFLRQIRKIIDKKAPGTLLIAEESSAWPQVTGKVSQDADENALGFDYKWNTGWKQELVAFMTLDPLFRKGQYDDLVNTMLYQYSEHYISEFSHKCIDGQGNTFYEMLPGNHKDEKDANLRTALGYLYLTPGAKLINEDLVMRVPEYMTTLNHFYLEHSQLYLLDENTDGFSWMDHSSKEETVLSFLRKDGKNQDLLVVINFTPVVRSEYKVGVDCSGKYKEVLNSDDTEFDGDGVRNLAVIRSTRSQWQGHEHVIKVTLPAMSVLVLTYEPYTTLELEEIKIKEDAARVKAHAEEVAVAAEEFKIKAEQEAKEALEAEKQAKEKAQAALEAKLKAEQKAEEARLTSIRIEEETAQRLEELHRKMIEMGE